MIAVVYSGSHYAHWRLADKGRTVASFRTTGMNPYFNDEKHIIQLFNKNINLIHHAEEIKKIYFYGAGVSTDELKATVRNAFFAFFKFAKVTVGHDIDAVALGCCKEKPGIVCICGSGSNAAWYDGRKIASNNFGLGYIMADEGSGNWLGKQLLKGFMSKTLPDSISKKFAKKYTFDRNAILDKVYRQKQPALFLSSFNDFFIENRDDAHIKQLINTGFDKLISTYVLPLHKQHPGVGLHFSGSVAMHFQDNLQEVAGNAGLEIESIVRTPINNLLTYYTNKN
ncbi:ATPase [Mucilaginibacter gynuensis]|uniref:ATPase n=1 Tax=Mucilaginibacter gynuensis TaxID=1302236 RepID=A0ABP8HKX6_9SPHI